MIRTSVLSLLLLFLIVPVFAQEQITEEEVNQEKLLIEANREKLLGNYDKAITMLRELFRQEIDTAYNEAKLLVSTFRGTKTDEAPRIVNGMLESMVTKS